MMRWLIILSAVFVCVATNARAQQTVQVTSGEYAPRTSQSAKGGGFTNHVIVEAFGEENAEVQFTYMSWKRAYNLAKSGEKFHATSYWACSDDRVKDFYCSDPLHVEETVFFYLKSNPLGHWETLDDLKDKHIGITDGYTYIQEIWDAKESGRLKIQVASTDELNFRKLLKGRFDLFLMEKIVGLQLLRDKFSPDLAEAVTFDPRPIVKNTAHLLFTRKYNEAEELVMVFNRGLSKILANGKYQQMEEDLLTGGYD